MGKLLCPVETCRRGVKGIVRLRIADRSIVKCYAGHVLKVGIEGDTVSLSEIKNTVFQSPLTLALKQREEDRVRRLESMVAALAQQHVEDVNAWLKSGEPVPPVILETLHKEVSSLENMILQRLDDMESL